MMPTAQKAASLIISDENANPSIVCSNNKNSCNESASSSANSTTHSIRPQTSDSSRTRSPTALKPTTSQTDHSSSANHKELINQNCQKILSDLTNNNIVDCLAKDLLNKEPTTKESTKDQSKVPTKPLTKDQAKDSNRDAVRETNKETPLKDSSKESSSKECSFRTTSTKDTSVKPIASIDTLLTPNTTKDDLKDSQSASASNRDSQISQASTTSSTDNQKSKHKKFVNQDSSSSNGSLSASNNVSKDDEPPRRQWKYSKTHQKRFKRRFPSIEPDEQLIDCKFSLMIHSLYGVSKSFDFVFVCFPVIDVNCDC